MLSSNKTNVTLKRVKLSPLQHDEVDDSFNELINVIDDVTDIDTLLNQYLLDYDTYVNKSEALEQILVQTVGSNVAPAGVEGRRYIVGVAPTGAWVGQANKLAIYRSGAWAFYEARIVVGTNGSFYIRPSSSWIEFSPNSKVDKVTGKGLSPEEFTLPEKTSLGELVDLAEFNVRVIGDYSPTQSLTVNSYNEFIRSDGELWRPSTSTTLPYVTNGTGMPEGGAFIGIGVGDGGAASSAEIDALRADIANVNDITKGSSLVGRSTVTVQSTAELAALPKNSKIVAHLLLGQKSGNFVYNSSNLSTKVGTNGTELNYVAPASDSTGASGAWVRQRIDLNQLAFPISREVTSPVNKEDFSLYRNANYTGGTPGFVNSAMRVITDVGANCKAFEWGIVSVTNNSAIDGENLAMYGQGNQYGKGPTWGMVAEVADHRYRATRAGDKPTWGMEIDCWANYDDPEGTRRGLVIVAGNKRVVRGENVNDTAKATVTSGILIEPWGGDASKAQFKYGAIVNKVIDTAFVADISGTKGFSVQGDFTIGYDTSLANLTGAAIKMKSGHYIGFDANDRNKLFFAGGAIQYTFDNNQVFAITNTGSLRVKSLTLNEFKTEIDGTFGTGTGTATFANNKPGANSSTATWLKVVLDGSTYWLPVFSN